METISNEEKAKEIAQSVSFFWTNEDDCEKSIIDTVSLRKAIFNGVLQAMEWKDEQFLQWLKENLAKETSTMFTSESQGVINFEPVIKAFEKFIKQ